MVQVTASCLLIVVGFVFDWSEAEVYYASRGLEWVLPPSASPFFTITSGDIDEKMSG
jgi:hypothetical protein